MQLSVDPEKWLILESVESTNSYLLQAGLQPGTVVFARKQTQGRGRRGRSWQSLPDDSLIFSGLLASSVEALGDRMRLFPLLAGLAVLRAARKALARTAQPDEIALAIKWPNDIYLSRNGVTGKLGGVLVESTIAGDELRIVIGVGLNYRGAAPAVADALVPPAVLFPGEDERAPIQDFGPLLVAEINRGLPELFAPYKTKATPDFLEELRAANYLRNRFVTKGAVRYRVLDFTDGGELLLEDAESGDIVKTDDASEDIRPAD